jgi:hypothetical protein
MMKKIFYAISLLLAFSLVITSCSNDEATSTATKDVVTEFFDSEWPLIGNGQFLINEDKCLIINSQEELNAIYCGKKSIPHIDFESLSVLVGQATAPDNGYEIEDIQFTDNNMLDVFIIKTRENVYPAFTPLHFWKTVTPKMTSSAVKVNVVNKSMSM